MKRICIYCKQNLDYSCFHKNSYSKNGISNRCKKCKSLKDKEHKKTKKGLITTIYYHQKNNRNSKKYPIGYTKNEFHEWMMGNKNFHELYKKWVESGYEKNKRPSVDRIDDYKGYSIDNIQLMTYEQNIQKSRDDRRNGINNKDSKAIIQIGVDGTVVKEYYSIKQAYRETGFNIGNISSVCCGRRKTAHGFVWKFKN